jgi:hypothetical protein
MVSLARTAADGLLEGEILFATEEKQVAHRRIVVGAAQHGVRSDADAGGQGYWVSGEPTDRCHPPHDFSIAPNQCDVDRVAGMAIGGMGYACQFRQGRVMAKVKLPQPRND